MSNNPPFESASVVRLRPVGLAELPQTPPFAKAPRLTILFHTPSHPPPQTQSGFGLTYSPQPQSAAHLCQNCGPKPLLAHSSPAIFYPLLLSPVVFHNNRPLPFLPPPPTARQAYLIPQPSSNQPTSLLVPLINNTDTHTHTHCNPPPWDFSFLLHSGIEVSQLLCLMCSFVCFITPGRRPINDSTVEVTAVTLWLLQLSLVVT